MAFRQAYSFAFITARRRDTPYREFVDYVPDPETLGGNAFGRVCLCVCPVRAVTFESVDLQTSFLVR